jgi:hypothetical protein
MRARLQQTTSVEQRYITDNAVEDGDDHFVQTG